MFSNSPDTPARRLRATSRRASRSALTSLANSPRASPSPAPQGSTRSPAPPTLSLAATRALSQAGGSRRSGKGSVVAYDEVMDDEDAEQEELGDKLLVKDESFEVLERKGLPNEVEEVIMSADAYMDPLRATLDHLTGFAFLVTREYCFVWNWQRRSSSATTYIFPIPPTTSLPSSVSTYTPLSFAQFVPSQSSSSSLSSQREPGLLIFTTTGTLLYWEQLSLSLSGVDRYKSVQLPLIENELVRGIEMIDSRNYTITTNQNRLIGLGINSSTVLGRRDLGIRVFSKPIGWAGSVWTAVFGSKTLDPKAGILALAVSSLGNGERVAYAVSDRNVEVWRLASGLALEEGGEKFEGEMDLFGAVLEALGGKGSNEEWAMNSNKVEILDAKATRDGKLAVLVSHVTERTLPNSLSYAVALLAIGTTPLTITPLDVRFLSYQAGPDPRPLSTPRLSLPGGDAVLIVFVDAIVITSLATSSFEESFPLRSNNHRFLGLSSSSPTSFSSEQGQIALSLLTSTSSILTILLDSVALDAATSEGITKSDGYQTRKLKAKIEQAIFFGAGGASGNIIGFELERDFLGDLEVAVEGISKEIVASASKFSSNIIDMRVHIADRIARLRALIDFINGQGLGGKLSQSCRRQLTWDAERLAAAAVLWHYQNANMSEEDQTLLSYSIVTYMNENGEGLGDDLIRTFFRTKVSEIGTVLEQVSKSAKVALGSAASSIEKAEIVHQNNTILLLAYNAVARSRKDSSALYSLDPTLLPSEAWSSKPALLDALQWSFDATDAVLKEGNRDVGVGGVEDDGAGGRFGGSVRSTVTSREKGNGANAQAVEFKKQMAALAEFVFSLFEERLLYLKAVNGDLTSPESRVLTERYLSLRPRFIRTLVVNGKVNNAYELAERHSDFRSLVELCNDPQHGSPAKIRFFMDKYSSEFAFELYQFYIEKGQLRTLMEQDEIYRPLLTDFLDSTDNPGIAWLNDIAIGRYGNATIALVGEAMSESHIERKKLMLSLGKLSQLAQATSISIATEEVQRAIEAVDDQLDMVNSQYELSAQFKVLLSGTDVRKSLSYQGEAVTSQVAAPLVHRPAFKQLYAGLATDLLSGKSLSPEDLIDLLSLKENVGDESRDYAAALEIFVRGKNIPDSRKEVALQSIWRRVYLRDDWAALRSATGLRDEDIASSLRATALYATLAAGAIADHPHALYLEPSQSLFIGTAEDLSARFSSASGQFLDVLLNDYEQESEDVKEAIQRHGLEEYRAEIIRLLERGDAMEEGEHLGEDSMMH